MISTLHVSHLTFQLSVIETTILKIASISLELSPLTTRPTITSMLFIDGCLNLGKDLIGKYNKENG